MKFQFLIALVAAAFSFVSLQAKADFTQKLPLLLTDSFQARFGGITESEGELVNAAYMLNRSKFGNCSVENVELSRTYRTDANGKVKTWNPVTYRMTFNLHSQQGDTLVSFHDADFNGHYFNLLMFKSHGQSARLITGKGLSFKSLRMTQADGVINCQ